MDLDISRMTNIHRGTSKLSDILTEIIVYNHQNLSNPLKPFFFAVNEIDDEGVTTLAPNLALQFKLETLVLSSNFFLDSY